MVKFDTLETTSSSLSPSCLSFSPPPHPPSPYSCWPISLLSTPLSTTLILVSLTSFTSYFISLLFSFLYMLSIPPSPSLLFLDSYVFISFSSNIFSPLPPLVFSLPPPPIHLSRARVDKEVQYREPGGGGN